MKLRHRANGSLLPRLVLMVALWLCTSAAAAASPEMQQEIKPTPLNGPQDWVLSDDYPAAALSEGVQGTTEVLLNVDVGGKVTGCMVTASSGSAVLDEGTCIVLRERVKFKPAVDKRNRPVKSIWAHKVAWRLPTSLPMKVSEFPRRIHVSVDVDEFGKASRCAIVEVLGDATFDLVQERRIDPCEEILASRINTPVIDADGKPVRATIDKIFETRLKIAPLEPALPIP